MASCISSAPSCAPSTGINPAISVSSPTRRGLLAYGAAALAAPLAVESATPWSAIDWITRWHALGCGLEVGHNALSLMGRLNGDRAAIGAMMVEVAAPDRQSAVIEALSRYQARLGEEDPALRVVHELESIDAEFVSEDVDPASNAAWLERWDRAFDRLPKVPATTSKGWAAKLRYAVEYLDTPRGNKLLEQTLRHLERGA